MKNQKCQSGVWINILKSLLSCHLALETSKSEAWFINFYLVCRILKFWAFFSSRRFSNYMKQYSFHSLCPGTEGYGMEEPHTTVAAPRMYMTSDAEQELLKNVICTVLLFQNFTPGPEIGWCKMHWGGHELWWFFCSQSWLLWAVGFLYWGYLISYLFAVLQITWSRSTHESPHLTKMWKWWMGI